MCSKKVTSANKQYLQAGDSSHNTTITVLADALIVVGNSIFKTTQTTLTPSNLDTGTAFEEHMDYYVYICDPSNGDESSDLSEVYKISKNSTYPDGYDEENSRKIGGFRYGYVRKTNDYHYPVNSSNIVLGSGWKDNVYLGIVPNSVWTLLFRPKCNPEAMVYLGSGLWGDINIAFDDGNHGCTPINNGRILESESAAVTKVNFYGCLERAGISNKRLPTYQEYLKASIGAPPGDGTNNYINSTKYLYFGQQEDFEKCRSGYNVIGLTGCTWRYCSNIMSIENTTSLAWANNAAMQLGGIVDGNCGSAYIYGANSVRVLCVGGDFDYSSACGRRCTDVRTMPWEFPESNLSPGDHTDPRVIGVWCVCEGME